MSSPSSACWKTGYLTCRPVQKAISLHQWFDAVDPGALENAVTPTVLVNRPLPNSTGDYLMRRFTKEVSEIEDRAVRGSTPEGLNDQVGEKVI